jgi:hypothetical protein
VARNGRRRGRTRRTEHTPCARPRSGFRSQGRCGGGGGGGNFERHVTASPTQTSALSVPAAHESRAAKHACGPPAPPSSGGGSGGGGSPPSSPGAMPGHGPLGGPPSPCGGGGGRRHSCSACVHVASSAPAARRQSTYVVRHDDSLSAPPPSASAAALIAAAVSLVDSPAVEAVHPLTSSVARAKDKPMAAAGDGGTRRANRMATPCGRPDSDEDTPRRAGDSRLEWIVWRLERNGSLGRTDHRLAAIHAQEMRIAVDRGARPRPSSTL